MNQYRVVSGEKYDVIDDAQKHRVYRWESEVVGPLDTNRVTLEVAQQIVNYIWEQEGRKFPPQVERKARGCADATRLKIRLPVNMLYTWIIIHELAHSFTSNEDGASNGHGSWFVQMYIHLLSQYAGMDKLMLMQTATQRGIKIKGVKNRPGVKKVVDIRSRRVIVRP